MGSGAKSEHVDPRLREFTAMADQPAFDPPRIGFQMELKPEDMMPKRKCLVGADVRSRQAHCTRRDVELVAMPVQHRYIAERSQRRVLSFRSQLQGA